jgi:hypothetical protein
LLLLPLVTLVLSAIRRGRPLQAPSWMWEALIGNRARKRVTRIRSSTPWWRPSTSAIGQQQGRRLERERWPAKLRARTAHRQRSIAL